MRTIGIAIVLMLTSAAAGPAPISAQAATAADAVQSILEGRDDEAMWGELESALDDAAAPAPLSRPTSQEIASPLEGITRPRVVAGVAGAVLTLLAFLALRVLVRTLGWAMRTLRDGRRGSRTLVRRRGRASTVSRDAARLKAVLRARRAA